MACLPATSKWTLNKKTWVISVQTSTPKLSKNVLRFNASGSSNNNFTSVSRIRWMAGTRTVMKACGKWRRTCCLANKNCCGTSSFPWESMSENSLWGCKDDQWLVWLVDNMINDLDVWTFRISLLEMPRAANNGVWRWDTVPPSSPKQSAPTFTCARRAAGKFRSLKNCRNWAFSEKKQWAPSDCYIMLHPSREGCISYD